MISELLQSRSMAPRKKFRGKARHFRKIRREAREFSLPPGGCYWSDGHAHVDWSGWGNLKWSYRVEYFKALAEYFRVIANTRHLFQSSFQCCIIISGRDAGEDAIHVYTANSTCPEFPFRPDGVDWTDERLLSLFRELLPEFKLRSGHHRCFDENAEPPREVSWFYVYSPEIGVSLEG